MQIVLRERDRDADILECLEGGEMQIAASGSAIVDIHYEGDQFELERAVAKFQPASQKKLWLANYSIAAHQVASVPTEDPVNATIKRTMHGRRL
jgi:hypothetical protein